MWVLAANTCGLAAEVGWLGRKVVGRLPLLHSSSELSRLSQWLCHDDSTINVL